MVRACPAARGDEGSANTKVGSASTLLDKLEFVLIVDNLGICGDEAGIQEMFEAE